MKKSGYLLDYLSTMFQDLRDPKQGDAWCLAQTWQSLQAFTIEETYELMDAIERNHSDDIKDELADMLLQILFYAQLANEQGDFNLGDILQHLISKIKARTPKLYSHHPLHDPDHAETRPWKHQKMQKAQTQDNLLSDIPKNLPPTQYSEKIQTRVASVNFDWQTPQEVIGVLKSEIAELEIAIESGLVTDMEDELGDVIFTTVNLARHLNTTVDKALMRSNRKFTTRFEILETLLKKDNLNVCDLPFDDLLSYWKQAKEALC
jgi:nucleoside triphosphate diphosphatase